MFTKEIFYVNSYIIIFICIRRHGPCEIHTYAHTCMHTCARTHTHTHSTSTWNLNSVPLKVFALVTPLPGTLPVLDLHPAPPSQLRSPAPAPSLAGRPSTYPVVFQAQTATHECLSLKVTTHRM